MSSKVSSRLRINMVCFLCGEFIRVGDVTVSRHRKSGVKLYHKGCFDKLLNDI